MYDYREATKEEKQDAVMRWLDEGGTREATHVVVCELQAKGILCAASEIWEWARVLHMVEWSPGHQRFVLRPGWRA